MGRRPPPRWWSLLLVTGLLVAAPVLLWRGLVTLPHRYDDLASRGVPVRVKVTSCGTGQGGDSRGVGCRVRMDYGSYSATWREGDLRGSARADGTVAGLVDPGRPQVHALADEVARRSGAGAHGHEVFMAFLTALAAALLVLVDVAVRPALPGVR